MRISLEDDSTPFSKQMAGLRQYLGSAFVVPGQVGVSARMMLPVLLPFLAVLRSELRDEVVPEQVMAGAADLLANIASTTVESMIDAPPLKVAEVVEELLTQAIHIACQGIAQAAAERDQPKLSIVQNGSDRTVIHMPPRRKA